MTSAVFGDFLGAGRRHLEAAVAAGEREAAALPAVVPSVHRLVTMMSLCLEDLAPCDEIEAAGRTDLQVWERAVVDTGAALRIAADCLHHSHPGARPGRTAGRTCSVTGASSRREPRPNWPQAGTCCTPTSPAPRTGWLRNGRTGRRW